MAQATQKIKGRGPREKRKALDQHPSLFAEFQAAKELAAALGSPTSAGVRRSGIGIPESVWNSGRRRGLFCTARARSVFRHSSFACSSSSFGLVMGASVYQSRTARCSGKG